MNDQTLNELLAELHREQTRALLEAIRDPECPASMFEAARKFLQDNKITSELHGNKAPPGTHHRAALRGPNPEGRGVGICRTKYQHPLRSSVLPCTETSSIKGSQV